jgi:hypothetical protein
MLICREPARLWRNAHNGRMQDLRWDHVKEWFDPAKNGTAPDLVVAGTTLADWEALLTLIRSEGWQYTYGIGDHRVELPSSAGGLFVTDPRGRLPSLRVWPDPNIEIILRPWSVGEIVGDVSRTRRAPGRRHARCWRSNPCRAAAPPPARRYPSSACEDPSADPATRDAAAIGEDEGPRPGRRTGPGDRARPERGRGPGNAPVRPQPAPTNIAHRADGVHASATTGAFE